MQRRRLIKAGFGGAAITDDAWPHPTVWRPVRTDRTPPGEGSRYHLVYGSPAYYAVHDNLGKRTGRFRRVDRPEWWPTISWQRLQMRCGNPGSFSVGPSRADRVLAGWL